MAFETREEILEQLMSQKKPNCPHCDVEMNLWEVPPISFSDGLGWGVPYLYICFNDECPLYIEGWKNLEENYAHKASYRCLCYPGTETYECLPVFGPMGGKGQIVDDEVIAQQEAIKEATKKGFSILANCYVEKDWLTAVQILVDPTQPARVRMKSAEMLGDFGDLETIEPLRGYKFGNEKLQEQVASSIQKIHKRFFTRECPFCAEIIKKRAKVCKHCGKDVAGV
jgi:hypothetical protein